jgi:diguanylate cyclase (GGDEF)-like protein
VSEPARRIAVSPTSLYPLAVAWSLRLRWIAVAAGGAWALVSRRPLLLTAFAVWALLGAWCARRARRERHPPLLGTSAADFVLAVAALRVGGVAEPAAVSLFAYFVVVLTLAYGRAGAAAAVFASAVGAAATAAWGPGAGWAERAVGFAALAVSAAALGAVVGRYEGVYGRLAQVTIHDRVTGLYNRRHFEEALDQLHRLAMRGGWPYAVVAIRVRGLPRMLETRERAAADRLLRLIGREMKAVVRGTDLVARLDDETFALALPEANRANAERVAEKVRRRVRGVEDGLDVSVGVAQGPTEGMDDAGRTLDAALVALAAAEAPEAAARSGAAGGEAAAT